MSSDKVFLPGSTLGIMGGGQLGRMFAQAAASMGYHVCVLEPGFPSPAGEVSRNQIVEMYDSLAGLKKISESVCAVTTEFENVPHASLAYFEEIGMRVAPGSLPVEVSQNRLKEKSFALKAGVPPLKHCAIRCEADIDAADEDLLPGILKTTTLGYDGKGQARVATKDDVRRAFNDFKNTECVLEALASIKVEASVIVARSVSGECVAYPAFENHHSKGILAYTVCPARISEETSLLLQEHAKKIAESLGYVGVLCVEFFVLESGEVRVNEMAPRPHNSGHLTIDACYVSQFEQQVRTLANLPLGKTTMHSSAVMLNILGDLWFDEAGSVREPSWEKILGIPGLKLHLYGKAEPRRARKMGHITVLGSSVEDAIAKARAAADALGLEKPE